MAIELERPERSPRRFGNWPAEELRPRRAASLQGYGHLEQALTAIPVRPDTDAARCDVLVELGQARRSGGMIAEAHAAFEESISLADRIGDEDRMLAAAVAFGAPQLWGSRDRARATRERPPGAQPIPAPGG